MIIEASMAQPAQHYIEDFFADAGSMPGFSFGMEKVSRDEQRHIGFGVKVLSELFAESEVQGRRVGDAAEILTPRGHGPAELGRALHRPGLHLEDIYAFGMKSVEMKWRATGYPLDEHPPGIYPSTRRCRTRSAPPAR